MSQKLINILKKLHFQTLKSLVAEGITLDDQALVKLAQSLLNAEIDSGDTIVDSEMPATFLGCTLDWSAGAANDTTVKITKGSYSVTQDLSLSNTIITGGVGAFQPLTMNGGNIVGSADNSPMINASIVFGDYVVFAANSGMVASYDYVNDIWHSPMSGTGVSSDGGASTGVIGASNILCLAIFDSKLVVAGDSGRLGSWNGTAWTKYSAGSGLCNNGTALGSTYAIRAARTYNSNLVIAGDMAMVASWDGSAWTNHDASSGLRNNGTAMDGDSIYCMTEYNGSLVVAGLDSRVASCSTETWTNYDAGSGICNGGTALGTGAVWTAIVYDSKLVIAGAVGYLASYDSSTGNWTNYNAGSGLCSAGTTLGASQAIKALSVYDSKLVVTGSYAGRVASWNGTSWTNYNTGSGLCNNGTALGTFIQVLCSVVQGTNLVVAGTYSRIASWDGTAWHNYDGAGTGAGPNYDAIMGAVSEEEILQAIVYDNHLVIGTIMGKISSYDFGTSTWNAFNKAGIGLWNYGSVVGYASIRSMAVYDNKLVVGCSSGVVASWNGTSWTSYNTGSGLCNNGTAIGSNYVRSMIVFGGNLIISGDTSKLASWDGTAWKNYDGTGTGTGIYNGNVLGAYSTMDMCIYDSKLIVAGGAFDSSRVSSYDGTNWKYYDGTGIGTGPFNYNTALGSNNMASCVSYDNKLVISGYNGRVASWNGTSWTNYNAGSGLCNNGTAVTAYPFLTVFGTILILAATNGQIASWDGTAWKNYDGSGTGTGIYNGGSAMNNKYIYKTVQYSTGIYFLGGDETIASYDGTTWHNYNT